MPKDCPLDLVETPEQTPIECGVELHWQCCDRTVAIQKSKPFRLFIDQIRFFHKRVDEYGG